MDDRCVTMTVNSGWRHLRQHSLHTGRCLRDIEPVVVGREQLLVLDVNSRSRDLAWLAPS